MLSAVNYPHSLFNDGEYSYPPLNAQ